MADRGENLQSDLGGWKVNPYEFKSDQDLCITLSKHFQAIPC